MVGLPHSELLIKLSFIDIYMSLRLRFSIKLWQKQNKHEKTVFNYLQ